VASWANVELFSGAEMSDEFLQKIASLEHTLHVLEEENSQLAERAEDAMLLGLISESSLATLSGLEILENTLERISILKSLPFVTCAKGEGTKIEHLCSYANFSITKEYGYPFNVSEELLARLDAGTCVVKVGNGFSTSFARETFQPSHAAFITFSSQAFETGIFIFMIEDEDEERLAAMLPLLSRAVEITIAKYDNVFLLQALTETNRNLESQVEKRTADLLAANKHLHAEMLERKASEQALQDSHQTIKTVLDSVDAMIYAADLENGKILFMNQRLQDDFGSDRPGKSFREAFHFDEEKEIAEYREQYLDKDGNPRDPIVWQAHSAKSDRWFVVSDRAVKWTDGRHVMLRIATDVSLVKQMETKLQHTLKMEAIGTLAGGIAHDFNNLLMGIQGRASLIATVIDPVHPAMEHVGFIEEHIKSAASLTKQILGFARGGKYMAKPVDLNVLVMKSCEMFGRTKKELLIRTTFHDQFLVAKIDESQVEQVLLNLFINAWQAMPGGGDLHIETRRVLLKEEGGDIHGLEPGNYCCITVTDSGTGMDENTRQKVFDPFFTTKEKERGTGLGLASAYGIVKNHQGIITVKSILGKGSTFTIYLPISEEAVEESALVEVDVLRGTETILLVDDEPMILEVGQQMLETLGYRVFLAEDGLSAVDLVENNRQHIDLVILDLIMPGMDGGETLDRLLNIRPDLPVLLSSGYSKKEYANQVMARGCRGFLQKPFKLSDLSVYIRNILDEDGSNNTNKKV
jgi:two-component system cell cycle sensor histidine kinase/response regulator CckA